MWYIVFSQKQMSLLSKEVKEKMRINRVKFAAALAKKDITCLKLAELSGVSRVTITAVKSGKSCSAATAERLAAVLGNEIIER